MAGGGRADEAPPWTPSAQTSRAPWHGLQVYRGRVLHNMKEKLCDVVADGDVLVLLPRRSVPPRPPPPEPTKVREIESGLAG